MSPRKDAAKTIAKRFVKPSSNRSNLNIANSKGIFNTSNNYQNPFNNKVIPVTNQREINLANNRGYFIKNNTGERDFDKAIKQFNPNKKTILNDNKTKETYMNTGIAQIFANRQYPGLNISKDEIPTATKNFVGMTDKQIAEYKAYKNSLQAAHPLMSDSRKQLPNQMLPYVEYPSFLTTGYRNMGSHKFYENRLNSYLDKKSTLVDKFKNKEISKGQFLMDKSGLDLSIKNTTRDMRKLGLESMIFDKANNKFKYYGGLYDNMAQLYKNMGDDYFLQNPTAIVPSDVSSKYFQTLMGYPKPTIKTSINKKGEFVEKDAKDAMKIGKGEWWSDRGRDNFGGYWRTKAPFMKNRGSNQNLNAGGLVALLGNKALQRMAQLLSPKQLKMLTDTKFKGTNPMNSPKNIRQIKLDNYLRDKYSATTNYPYKRSSVPGPRSSGDR